MPLDQPAFPKEVRFGDPPPWLTLIRENPDIRNPIA